MSWERIDCRTVAWEGFEEGLADETTTDVRWLREQDPWIVEARHPATSVSPAHYHPFDVVYLYRGGSLSMDAEPGQVGVERRPTMYEAGELRFVKAGTVYGPETTGTDGSLFYTFTFGGRPSVAYADDAQVRAGTDDLAAPGSDVWWRGRWAEGDWSEVSLAIDGADRVVVGRILSTFGVHAAMLKLEPGQAMGSLSHQVDSVLLAAGGECSIGSEGTYGYDELRWTPAGDSYGPIVGGPEGCEILILSSQGPAVAALGA